MQENICKNCGNIFTGKFCNNCGEKYLGDKDKSLVNVLGEGFHFITHLEGTFFTTLKAILLHPGKMSDDYCNGIRKRYFKPLSFFLLLVVLYLLFPAFEGLNMQLKFYRSGHFFSAYINNSIATSMAEKQLNFDELSELFHRHSEKISKFLLITIIPVMALFSWLIARKRRRFYFDHFILSIEQLSFFILWGFLILPLVFTIVNVFRPGTSGWNDNFLGTIISVVFLIYNIVASRRFFKYKFFKSFLYALLWSAFFIFYLQWIYKFILFFITINTL